MICTTARRSSRGSSRAERWRPAEIELGATEANGAGEIVIEDVRSLASGSKRMRFFGGSLQSRAGPQLSEVLQTALRDLLIRIGAGLPRPP